MVWFRTIGSVALVTMLLPTAGPCPARAQTPPPSIGDAETLKAQGQSLYSQGKYAEAEPLYRKVLEIRRATLGENHPDTGDDYNDLALSVKAQGRFAEAEPLFRKSLEIIRSTLGEKTVDTAASYNNLGLDINAQGRYREAEPLLRTALNINRALFGENDQNTATNYNNLAFNLYAQGRYGEAEPVFRKSLEVIIATRGAESAEAATSDNNLAANLNAQGRYGEAESLYRKALDIRRATLGESHPLTASSYNNVATNLDAQGRYAEAEPLYQKSLDLRRAELGENHPATATSYSNLALNIDSQGRHREAEPLFRKALDIRLSTLGGKHPETALGYNGVAFNLKEQGHYDEALLLYKKALDIRLETLGENHPDTGASYNNLAADLTAQKRYLDAEPLYRKALASFLNSLGENHSATASSYNNLAYNLDAQGRTAEAEAAVAKAVEIARRARSNAIGERSREQPTTEKSAAQAYVYANYLMIATKLAASVPPESQRLQASAFRVAQDMIGSASAQAMADAAVRASAGTDALAAIVREQQDLAVLAGQTDKRLLAALGRSDTARAAQLRSDYDDTLAKLAIVEARIDKDYPSYRELISPKPLDLADAQKALVPGEGLIVLVEADDAIYSFGVTRDAVAWNRVEGDAKAILKQVATLRCNVDPDACSDEQRQALDALPATKAEQDGYQRFDLVTAYALYTSLIAPVERALKGVSRLYVTSSGSLGDLPLGMLVTAQPATDADLADPDVLLNASWLSDRYALTTLPAVSALRLRALAKTSLKPSTAFRGYGNPVLAQAKGGDRGGTYYRGAGADGIRLGDPDRLRTMPSLPGTKTELEAMAGLYPMGNNALTMGAGATESALKNDPLLKQTNIIAFATHGLLPTPGKGMDEPGLVFTPPKVASTDDDGILTASEASQLSFLADWVILSACNTASTASGAGGSDSLSALARAFLYAGAHALLASHWQVSDKATAALTVETLTARRDNPKLTRAQALQQAMHSVRTGKRPDGSAVKGWDQSWLHPSAWAAFSHIANSDE